MRNEPLISVIIVNWNGKSILKDCLDAITKVNYIKLEILLVDNASVDGSLEFVKKNYPSIKVFVNKENLGVGGGFEVGLRKVKGQAVLLLNTDAIIQKNLLTNLVKVLYSDKKIGAVQPKLVLYPNKNLIDSIGCFFLSTGDLYHFGREKNPNEPPYNKRMEIFSTKGACMLIKTEVLNKIGLFDKDFFAYFEDTDFCIRMLLAGSNILFHSYKNRINSYLKNFSIKYLVKVLPLMLFLYEIVFFGYILTGRFQYALAVQKGIIWNLINLKSILKNRKYVQENIRKISDDEYIPRLTKNVRLMYYWYQFFGGMEKYKD